MSHLGDFQGVSFCLCALFALELKSTLWTNTGQDRNFQKTLSAIGPYAFRGKFIWTNHWSIPFPGKFVWTNGPESSSKVSPYTGIGPWMAFPSLELKAMRN